MWLFIIVFLLPVSALSQTGDEGVFPEVSLEISNKDSQESDPISQEGFASQDLDPTSQESLNNSQRDCDLKKSSDMASIAKICFRAVVEKACDFFESFDSCVDYPLEHQRACQLEYEARLTDYNNLLNPILNWWARDLLEYAFSDGLLSQAEYTEQKLQEFKERYCESS